MSTPRKNTQDGRPKRPAAAKRTAKKGPSRDREPLGRLCGELGIPPELVQRLTAQGLLRPSPKGCPAQAEFTNAEGTYSELYGPGGAGPEVRSDGPDASWGFRPYPRDGKPEVAYVCGSAVEALSLYLCDDLRAALSSPAVGLEDDARALAVLAQEGPPRDALYCCAGGFADRGRVDRLLAKLAGDGVPAFLALGWDGPGQERLRLYGRVSAVITRRASWNEHLLLDLRGQILLRLERAS